MGEFSRGEGGERSINHSFIRSVIDGTFEAPKLLAREERLTPEQQKEYDLRRVETDEKLDAIADIHDAAAVYAKSGAMYLEVQNQSGREL